MEHRGTWSECLQTPVDVKHISGASTFQSSTLPLCVKCGANYISTKLTGVTTCPINKEERI
eukprot:3083939-Prorocentrum_lima.AAC.1